MNNNTNQGSQSKVQSKTSKNSSGKLKQNILILGGTGKTGQLIVQKLLEDKHNIKVVIRKNSTFPDYLSSHENISIIEGNILELSDYEIENLIEDCDIIISSLGHNLTLKGIFCKPRLLVTQTLTKLSLAIKKKNIKILLMNSAGVSNRNLTEYISFSQKCIIFL